MGSYTTSHDFDSGFTLDTTKYATPLKNGLYLTAFIRFQSNGECDDKLAKNA